MDDTYAIADIAMIGWVRGVVGFYEAGDLVDDASLAAVPAWLDSTLACPAVQCGVENPKRP